MREELIPEHGLKLWIIATYEKRKAHKDKDQEIALVETHDISALLEFTFWQEVLYLLFDESLPDTKVRV